MRPPGPRPHGWELRVAQSPQGKAQQLSWTDRLKIHVTRHISSILGGSQGKVWIAAQHHFLLIGAAPISPGQFHLVLRLQQL